MEGTNIKELFPSSAITYTINGEPVEIVPTKEGFILKTRYTTSNSTTDT